MTQTYPYWKNTSYHIDEDKPCLSTNYSDCVGGATTPRRHVRIVTRVIMNMFRRVTYEPLRCSARSAVSRGGTERKDTELRSESDERNSRGNKTEERKERDRSRRRGEKSTRFRLSRLFFFPLTA